MKHVLCALLVVSLAAPATTTFAADNAATTTPEKSAQSRVVPSSFRASIGRAVEATDAVGFSSGPQAPRPRTGDGRALKQMGAGGGSKMGMIIGLVSTVAGIGLTVYMVKAMKNSTHQANAAQ